MRRYASDLGAGGNEIKCDIFILSEFVSKNGRSELSSARAAYNNSEISGALYRWGLVPNSLTRKSDGSQRG
jgi:hypothetical protein